MTNTYGELRPNRKRPRAQYNEQFDVYDASGLGYEEEYDDLDEHFSEGSAVSEGSIVNQLFLLSLLILIFIGVKSVLIFLFLLGR